MVKLYMNVNATLNSHFVSMFLSICQSTLNMTYPAKNLFPFRKVFHFVGNELE